MLFFIHKILSVELFLGEWDVFPHVILLFVLIDAE